MSDAVVEFDPSVPVRITDAALQHLRQQIARAGAAGLRLGIRESGCTGYRHVLDVVTEAQTDGVPVMVAPDVRLWIDPDALGIVRGTTIDYVREGINRVLRFDNPNRRDQCGCGESFNV